MFNFLISKKLVSEEVKLKHPRTTAKSFTAWVAEKTAQVDEVLSEEHNFRYVSKDGRQYKYTKARCWYVRRTYRKKFMGLFKMQDEVEHLMKVVFSSKAEMELLPFKTYPVEVTMTKYDTLQSALMRFESNEELRRGNV